MRAMLLALALSGAAANVSAADWRPLSTSSTGDKVLVDRSSVGGPRDSRQALVRFEFPKPDRRGAVRAEAQLEADCRVGQLRALDGGEYRANGTATVRATNRPGNWEDVAARPTGKAIYDALCASG